MFVGNAYLHSYASETWTFANSEIWKFRLNFWISEFLVKLLKNFWTPKRGKALNCNFLDYFCKEKAFFCKESFFFPPGKGFFLARKWFFWCKGKGLNLQCAASFCKWEAPPWCKGGGAYAWNRHDLQNWCSWAEWSMLAPKKPDFRPFRTTFSVIIGSILVLRYFSRFSAQIRAIQQQPLKRENVHGLQARVHFCWFENIPFSCKNDNLPNRTCFTRLRVWGWFLMKWSPLRLLRVQKARLKLLNFRLTMLDFLGRCLIVEFSTSLQISQSARFPATFLISRL